MDELILLPSAKDVLSFVDLAEQSNEQVTVSVEGLPYSVSGSSLLGMMTIIGSRIKVHAQYRFAPLAELLCRYRISS